MNKITVGLDLGTDNCCMTYQDKIGRPFIIMVENDYKISSIIGVMDNGLLIGNEISKSNIYDIPIICNLKRLIGNKSNNPHVKHIASYYNWTIEDKDDDLIINSTLSLDYLMTSLLTKIKSIIINRVGEDFNMVITIPANFNEGNKNKILTYCNQVGIDCINLIYEPCSAALAYINYCYTNTDSDVIRILVFDFGAGTLDLAIVSCNTIENETMAKIESNIGDNNLGGIDIDILLKEYIISKYPSINDIINNNFIFEEIKIKLSTLTTEKPTITYQYKMFQIVINIVDYYKLLDDAFKQKIILLLDELHLNNQFIKFEDIDEILLIGGSCYNPWIKQLISNYYQKQIQTFKILMYTNTNTIDIDIREIAVSLGATCYNNKLNKNTTNLILTESLPLSIGIDTVNNIMCKILPKNTLIPCSIKKYFSTSEDFQKEIEIKLYQGERENVLENFYLGSFKIENLEPELKGKIVLIINVSVSTDGLIIVDGKIKNTDKYNKRIVINRYNKIVDQQQINNNIRRYETNDTIFSNIMIKYYELVSMLSRLEYNLLNNIIDTLPTDRIIEIVLTFWDDLIIIYNLMLESDKLKSNIKQLTTFINNIQTKLNIKQDQKQLTAVDHNIILNLIDKLNKFIIENYQHMVLTYQIKTVEIEKYSKIEVDENIQEVDEYSQIKELLMMVVENIETFEMPSSNKLLLLDFIDKYDIYINENNKNGNLDQIQQICSIISDITSNDRINELYDILLNNDIQIFIDDLFGSIHK